MPIEKTITIRFDPIYSIEPQIYNQLLMHHQEYERRKKHPLQWTPEDEEEDQLNFQIATYLARAMPIGRVGDCRMAATPLLAQLWLCDLIENDASGVYYRDDLDSFNDWILDHDNDALKALIFSMLDADGFDLAAHILNHPEHLDEQINKEAARIQAEHRADSTPPRGKCVSIKNPRRRKRPERLKT